MKKTIVLAMAIIFVFTGLALAGDVEMVMEVKNEAGELSGNTFLMGDTAYYCLWGSINQSEALFLWRDMTILKNRGIKKLSMYINSGGGQAPAGMSMADTLRLAGASGMHVEIHASGMVASAAVPIYLSAEKRSASKNTTFMIHRGTIFKWQTSETLSDLNSQREMMQMSEDQYITFVEERTTLTRKEIEEKLDKTTWFTAEQAKEWGFVHEIK